MTVCPVSLLYGSILEGGSHCNARGKASYNSGHCTILPCTLKKKINWLLGAKLLIPARGYLLFEAFPLSQVLSWYKSEKSVQINIVTQIFMIQLLDFS